MSSSEQIEYKEYHGGLGRIDAFIANQATFEELEPFTLPVKYKGPRNNWGIFEYYLGKKTGSLRYLKFSIGVPELSELGESIYVYPQSLTAESGQAIERYNLIYYTYLHA